MKHEEDLSLLDPSHSFQDDGDERHSLHGQGSDIESNNKDINQHEPEQSCSDIESFASHKAFRGPMAGVFRFVAPSFLHGLVDPPADRPERILRPTAYLDALRGIGAWSVFNSHVGLPPNLSPGNLLTGMISNGSSGVMLFFVLSGYVISLSLLRTVQLGDPSRVLDHLASAIYRRWARLVLPSLVATFFSALAVQAGFLVMGSTKRYSNFWLQLGSWVQDSVMWTNPLINVDVIWESSEDTRSIYAPQLWTIQAELRASLAIFLLVCATATMTPTKRYLHVALVIVAFYIWGAVWLNAFFLGLALALVSLSSEALPISAASLPLNPWIPNGPTRRVLRRLLPVAGFPLALLFYSRSGPGNYVLPFHFPWPFLSSLLPPWWSISSKYFFYPSLSAVITIALFNHYPGLRWPLETRFFQYFGRISFALYLTHVSVLWSAGAWVRRDDQGVWVDTWTAWLKMYLVVFILSVWSADRLEALDQSALRMLRRVSHWAYRHNS